MLHDMKHMTTTLKRFSQRLSCVCILILGSLHAHSAFAAEVPFLDFWGNGDDQSFDHPGADATYRNSYDPIELSDGESLVFSFDITGHDNGDNDHLDVRLGMGAMGENPGYWNPAVDVGVPSGTTAVIRYRNGSSNSGSTTDNVVVSDTNETPANGGLDDSTTVNSIAFATTRTAEGFDTQLTWNDIVITAFVSTTDAYISSQSWNQAHIRLNVDASDTFRITNLRLLHSTGSEPPKDIVLTPEIVLSSTAINSLIGTLETESTVEQAFIYQLVSGSGDGNNDLLAIEENLLFTTSSLSSLSSPTLSFRLSTTDEQGLSLEKAFQLPVETDSDSDGLPDAYELRFVDPGNLNTLNGNGIQDTDSDGLTDLDELIEWFRNALDLDPTQPDTDGDQLKDGEEIMGAGLRSPTDPTSADTDGDGLSDGVESNTRIYVDSSDTGTNPLATDTDRDGFRDNIETNTNRFVTESNPGTNPNDSDTDADGLNDHEEIFPDPELSYIATDPTKHDTDGDSFGDLYENVLFTDPLSPQSAPARVPFGDVFFWNDEWSFVIDHPGGSVTYESTFDPIELLHGEALTFAFDMIGHDNGDADHLDVRLGFGSDSATPGYWNPSIDVGPPEGTTALIRYRNDNANNSGSNVENTVVVDTDAIPSGGGIIDSVTVNHIEFTVARSDSGYDTRLIWDDITLQGATVSTTTGFTSSPIWEKAHIRLSVDEGDLMTVSNLKMTYEELVLPPVFVQTDIELMPPAIERDQDGVRFVLTWTSEPGQSYQIQISDDLLNWTTVESNYPTGGATDSATSYMASVEVNSSAVRFYRVAFVP